MQVCLLKGTDVRPGLKEGGGRRDEHGGVDRTGNDHGYDHVYDFKAEETFLLFRLFDNHASLGQGGVQEDGMWHDGCTQDAGCQKDAFGVGEVWDKGAVEDETPFRAAEKEFDHITEGNNSEKASDDSFQRAEPVAFQAEDEKSDYSGQQAGYPKWKAEEQVERHCCAQEFSQIGGHSDQLHEHPHSPHNWAWEAFTAVLGQVPAGGNAEFGGERLQEHGHHVTAQDNPQQFIAELCAGLNIGGEIAGIHIGDAGDERWTEERQ